MRPCAECGTPYPVPPVQGRGRPRLYCSDRCRWRAASRRRRLVPLPPPDPAFAPSREEIAESLASLLPERPTTRPDEQLVTLLLELQAIAGRLAFVERRLPPRLAGRVGLLEVRLREALRVSFPEAVDP